MTTFNSFDDAVFSFICMMSVSRKQLKLNEFIRLCADSLDSFSVEEMMAIDNLVALGQFACDIDMLRDGGLEYYQKHNKEDLEDMLVGMKGNYTQLSRWEFNGLDEITTKFVKVLVSSSFDHYRVMGLLN